MALQINFSSTGVSFNWLKTKSQMSNPTKRTPRRPSQRDMAESLTVNAELTRGLYHNAFPGLKLAGAMAYTPIALPVFFMGLPIPVSENKSDQEILTQLVDDFSTKMQSIHRQCHREGTVWVWPRYNRQSQSLVWEFLPDESVSDIIRDIETGEIVKLIVDEDITIAKGYNTTANVRRTREFTRDRVETRWSGQVPEGVNDIAFRNPIGVIPIPFANNKDGEDIRGHSDYERIIADLKDYHDIDFAQSEDLAKFRIKMIQEYQSSESVDAWLENQGVSQLSDINVATTDLIMNKHGEESTTFAFPSTTAFEPREIALKRKFRKIVEGSGIPEIIWGVKTEGNYASVEDQKDTFAMYVEAKRDQITEPYRKLFESSLMLMNMAGEIATVPDIDVKWNELSMLSEKTKAEIFQMFARGISELINASGLTKEQLHGLWRKIYPEITDEDMKKFIEGLSDMAQFKQYREADYIEARDLTAEDPSDTNGDEI